MAKAGVRKRNTASAKSKVAQKKNEEDSKVAQESRNASSSGLMVVLIVMVAVTWGVAATSYFGIVDYKAIMSPSKRPSFSEIRDFISTFDPTHSPEVRHPLRTIGQGLISIDNYISNLFVFKKELYTIVDKRRPVVAPITPPRKMIKLIDIPKEFNPDFGDESVEVVAKEKVIPPSKSPPVVEDEPVQTEETVKEQPKAKPTKTEEQPTKETPVKSNKKEAKKKPSDSLTSGDDVEILTKIKEGENLLSNNKASQAKMLFTKLTKSNPKSPRALFGLAQAEEMQSEQERSNKKLLGACELYIKVAQLSSCTDELKKKTLRHAADKYYFLGKMRESLRVMRTLADAFPDDIEIINKFGVSFLFAGMNKQALDVFNRALKLDPDDGFALVHKGFIVKANGDWNASIPLLKKGVMSNEPGTQEGKFYFHLGDALYRTQREDEADEIYELGAKRGLFRSKYQRSLYNVDHLKGQPFWTPAEAGVDDYVKQLRLNWKLIRKEALSVFDSKTGLFKLEDEGLKDTGEWRQFTLYQRGKKNDVNCQRVPNTCAILDRMPNAIGCRRGQVKFSVMEPGTHIWPHTGPTNCRLRMHLGLVVPTTGNGCQLICAGETRHWEEGKVLIFDDSFEHEVYQEAESYRLILIIDIWHPELTDHEKRTLTAI